MGLIYVLVIFFIVAIACIIFLIRSIKRKSIVGIGISSILILILSSLLFINNFDENNLSKQQVKNDLYIIDIELNDDFSIVSNKISGMPERYQETIISISKNDALKVISEMKGLNSKIISKRIHYKEVYLETDNIPTRLIVSLEDGSHLLKYQKLED